MPICTPPLFLTYPPPAVQPSHNHPLHPRSSLSMSHSPPVPHNTSPSTSSLPIPSNPPVHHFSTVIYPNTHALNVSTSSASQLDALNYGRLGSPLSHTLTQTISRLFHSHATLLTPSKPAALTAILSTFLRPSQKFPVPHPILPDSCPTLHSLFPRLGVTPVPYTSLSSLKHHILNYTPPLVLLQPPIPPTFSSCFPLSSLPSLLSSLPTDHPRPIFILDNYAHISTNTNPSLLSSLPIDIILSSADRSGGLFDSDNSLFFGIISCKTSSLYRKLRQAVKGRTGVASASPSSSDCQRALFAIRTAHARRAMQLANVRVIVDALTNQSCPGLQSASSCPQSLDVALRVDNLDSFLDALSVIRIGDAVASGSSRTFAWPCFADRQESELHNCVVVSVGLEDPLVTVRDIQTACEISEN